MDYEDTKYAALKAYAQFICQEKEIQRSNERRLLGKNYFDFNFSGKCQRFKENLMFESEKTTQYKMDQATKRTQQ